MSDLLDAAAATLAEIRKENGAANVRRLPVPVRAGETNEQSDLGNAEAFIREEGQNHQYIPAWHKWLWWDDRRWLTLHEPPMDAAARTARVMLANASEVMARVRSKDDEEEALKRWKWARQSQDAKRLRACLDVARGLPELTVQHSALDSDSWLLNVRNGTIDLRTGKLRARSRTDLITKLTDIVFDPSAPCPTWQAFLSTAMGGNENLISYLQRIVGYALTGEIREHVLVFLFGDGKNGKSTFMGILVELFGDYATMTSRELLFPKPGQHPTSLATLFGARLAVAPEVKENEAFDEARLKDITGGDKIQARRMREDEWSFSPTHKLMVAGNHKPRVTGADDGVWRRMKLVPWTVCVPTDQIDTRLPEKLRNELPGILAWAVAGCLAWQRTGLQEPTEVTEATNAYRAESDVLGRFLEESCVFEPEAKIARATLRESYTRWCDELGTPPVGARRFAEGLRVRGAVDGNIKIGGLTKNGWRGVRLRQETELIHGAE